MRYILLHLFLFLSSAASIAQVADAGPDTSICVTSYTMQGSPVPPGGVGTWTLVAGCGMITNPNDPVAQTTLCVGTNVWQWTVVESDGTVTASYVAITVYDGSVPAANAGQDVTITLPTTSVQLNGSPVPVYPQTCFWTMVQGSGTIVDPTDPHTLATGLIVGYNVFRWNCDNGPCGVTSDDVVVEVRISTNVTAAIDGYNPPWVVFDPWQVRLHLTGTAAIDNLIVTDVQGRVVSNIATVGGQRSWSMADRAPGVYIVRALVSGQARTMRFVVER